MEYSITQLTNLAGVSARTLRYYDQIGLLKPLYVTETGYRYYGDKEVALLQQILFYRQRGFDLKKIQQLIYQEDFDVMSALEEHLLELKKQRKRIDSLIFAVQQTILSMKGEYSMSDKEKFLAFKKNIVKENEEQYGAEIRSKYGNAEMDEANHKILNMSRQEWEEFHNLELQIKKLLQEAVLSHKKPDSEHAKNIVQLHKDWLLMTWKQYSTKAHISVTSMYTCDDRFMVYYDEETPGCTKFLQQAVAYWAEKLTV